MATVTIAVPTAHVEDANQLARCIGIGPDDDRTFSFGPNMRDGAGNSYTVVSGWVVDYFAQIATAALNEPAWGCDLAAAQRAQALVRIGEAATPDTIAAVMGDDLCAALAVMGLSAIPAPPTSDAVLA